MKIYLIRHGQTTGDIEDRYGDLQELYWKSKDGDIVVNNLNSKSTFPIILAR